jgi:heat shock protein HslJ
MDRLVTLRPADPDPAGRNTDRLTPVSGVSSMSRGVLMSRHVQLTGLVLVALLVLGCADATVAPSEPTPAAGLVGSAWLVASINGQAVMPDAPPTMAFGADGMVSGSGGCNQYSAPYRTDGGSISVGDISSTLMLCQGAVGTQEAVFLQALRGATTWRVDEDGALHLDGAGTITGEAATQAPTAEPSPAASGTRLIGTWDLVEIGPTADFANLVPTIVFAADGSVSGFAGCNSFSGSYTTAGSTLTFGPLASTKMACQRPASAVEDEYLRALAGVSVWSIGGDGRLTLQGAIPLRYAPH